jgi:phosphotransferase system  glucose/maltose/N-acetylglucosamine-specific IIC component
MEIRSYYWLIGIYFVFILYMVIKYSIIYKNYQKLPTQDNDDNSTVDKIIGGVRNNSRK